MRAFLAALGCLAALCGHGAASAADGACDRLTVPEELGLSCEAGPGEAEITVRPLEGEFAALSRLGLRELGRDGEDADAWDAPDEWLQRQVTIGTDGIAAATRGLSADPDSPFGGAAAETALGSVLGVLGQIARLPLTGCEQPAPHGPNAREMRCRFTAAGVGVHLLERLVISGERRFAIELRTMNEQRLRHFEAIANSFRPAP